MNFLQQWCPPFIVVRCMYITLAASVEGFEHVPLYFHSTKKDTSPAKLTLQITTS